MVLESELEIISQQGCDFVRKTLISIKNKQIPEELSHLSLNEIQQLQHELEQIMAVYDS